MSTRALGYDESATELVVVGNWRGPIGDAAFYMNDELREELHSEMAPCGGQAFVDAYVARHLERFGVDFEFN